MFIIDKFAGAKHLIDEMTIAPSHYVEVEDSELEAIEMQ